MLKGEKEKKLIVEQKKKNKEIKYSEFRYMYFTTKSIPVI